MTYRKSFNIPDRIGLVRIIAGALLALQIKIRKADGGILAAFLVVYAIGFALGFKGYFDSKIVWGGFVGGDAGRNWPHRPAGAAVHAAVRWP